MITTGLFQIVSKCWRAIRAEGFSSLVNHARQRLGDPMRATHTKGVMALMSKRDVPKFFSFILNEHKKPRVEANELNAKTINWFIPDFGIGSGGHLNIFRYIYHLENSGYACRLIIVGHHRHKSEGAALREIQEHFFPLNAAVFFGGAQIPDARFSFATSWITAYHVRNVENTIHKLYFIQDFEPYFYPHGSEYAFAEATYKFGFTAVTAGQWLQNKMEREYQTKSLALGFSYDRNLYRQYPRREAHIRRVFCYVRPPTVRRGLETALLTLDLVGRELPDVKFIFAGWDISDYAFDHEHLNAGMVPIRELPDLYSQCDVALVLSFTNASLLPLELMACGCCVVSNSGENVEWLLNETNAVLTAPDPRSLAASIVDLLNDDSLRHTLSEKAKAFAEKTSWEQSVRDLVVFLETLDANSDG
jgi:O-antigen biosynthesis protein